MALSLGDPQGWPVNNVAQAPASTAVPAPSHLEAREGPAQAQWQAVKEEIRMLYEKKPLKEVRKILEQRHGFRATERMYKARLSQWGISKNYSDKDYQICAVLHHSRQKSGKRATAFVVHGHKRSLKDLHKYIKGRKMSEDEFLTTALKNIVLCNDRTGELQEPYAHVRAYTPEPETETEDQQSTPTTGQLSGEITASVAKQSPQGAETEPGPSLGRASGLASRPGSGSGATSGRRSTAHRESPTSQRLSPHGKASPPTRQICGTQFPPKDGAVSVTWQSPPSPSSRGPLVSSPLALPSSAALSFNHPVANLPLGSFEDQVRHAGTVHDSMPTPTTTCQRLGREVEYMALQIIDAPPLKSLCGHDDVRTWRLMSDTSSVDTDDYEKICPTCHEPTQDHFISLPNLEMPQQSRSILNETSSAMDSTISVPASSRGHEHSWRWVARCFAAYIYMNRANDTLTQRSLEDANLEFEKMLIPQQDPKILLALSQTLLILNMHGQPSLTEYIMSSAHSVAEHILGPEDPLTIITRWMVDVAKLEMKTSETTSATLKSVAEQFILRHGHTDPRSIASLYCYGYMLNVERRLNEAEQVLIDVYQVSSATLGPRHLQSISALTNLHRALARQGRSEEAIGVLRKAIDDSRDTLGENHPRRLESMRLLAVLYEDRRREDLTEELYWKVLEGRIKMLGRNHRFTLGIRNDLEALLKRMGKWGVERPRNANVRAGAGPSQDRDRDQDESTSTTEFEMEIIESPEQLRIQDLFEWDPDEKWDETRSFDGSDDTGSMHEAF
ncbi:uncharacterized protein Z518_08417 [Rhinocladiella mackenziei CBS 650.93]|uniref:Clr5 domain-containing protein n=1 Tax=Rhinocladiella mackenziei CBS 650.93 TaxID=1442369 RepID=A0A0D2IGS4_9EURO|nr:uncharacterized protein Z518_08417 [Rhinocladiella mackenziei CBS 650.93]KIX02476.1 hypothetical protein Z518_08417 [Rhinocladiella mackenziei CBS 650.93]